MTYDRFEQLPVWQAAIDLGERVYAATEKPGFVGVTACATNSSEPLYQFPITSPRALNVVPRKNC
jgi:hypothetical protein